MINEELTTSTDEFGGEFAEAPRQVMDCALRIKAIRRIEDKIDATTREGKEAIEFYAKRIENLRQQQEFLKGHIEGFLRTQKLNSVITHLGGAILRSSTKVQWPSADQLIEWAKGKSPDLIKEEVVRKPVLKNISLYIKETGQAPPGYEEYPHTSLVIKAPNAQEPTLPDPN